MAKPPEAQRPQRDVVRPGGLFIAEMTAVQRAGVTPLDQEVIARVCKSGVPCLIAANKCDVPADDVRAAEFARFGLSVYPTSAEHGRGVETLKDAGTER